ncbi:scarecrow-like protein 22-like [Dorcoceras hygrometricum]|uniref:Scarecrow-like protein 22-like n=1 Tax=Dorcoceras hygrometricum TaxID=472368 RepID=A0A2Z7CPL6_9LAMI|nr:scarecrow-like protein 22-like [Dorcoceras hygrometricum]
MPLPFDFEGTGVLDLELILRNRGFFSDYCNKSYFLNGNCGEPTSVLDSARVPSRPSSSSTLSSSFGGGGGGGADTELLPVPPSLEIETACGGGNAEKCGVGDWESVFSGSVAPSPVQEQSIFRWILSSNLHSNPVYSSISNNLGSFALHQQPAYDSPPEMKSPICNPQLHLNQNQTQYSHNSLFFSPLTYSQHQESDLFASPQAKRLNSGSIGGFLEPSGGHISKGSYFLTSQNLHQKPIESVPNSIVGSEEQQAIDQLYKVAELVQTGNPILTQGILARLNHQFSPIDKPFRRAAFYCEEALQMLLHSNNTPNMSSFNSSPCSLVFKIGAYKSFSEISPLVQFTNFTCNQAILEALDGFDRIHIVDFDIGYGGQWASLIHELASRGRGVTLLKITAVVFPSTHDQIELGLTRENLVQFAGEINLDFEFEAMSIDSFNSSSWCPSLVASGNEAVAVNLPFGSFMDHQLPVSLVLHRVKQLSPRIVVSVNKGCDRADLSFPGRVINIVQTYSSLLESLEAASMNTGTLQKIERFLIQPGIQKSITGHFRIEKPQNYMSAFLSSGFTPATFSSIAESQAECVVKRTPVRGFHLENDQSSLLLCWKKMELISASAWRCYY